MTKQAFIVGINDYKNRPLRGCCTDAIAFATLLKKQFHFDEVSLVLGDRNDNKDINERAIVDIGIKFNA